MPNNKVIYLAVLIIAATALLWAGNWVMQHINWIFPYVLGTGLFLLVIGIIIELRKPKTPPQEQPKV